VCQHPLRKSKTSTFRTSTVGLRFVRCPKQMVFGVSNYSVSHIEELRQMSLERLMFRREQVLIARSPVLWIRGGIESAKILILRFARTR
jgi:hypothetical protein